MGAAPSLRQPTQSTSHTRVATTRTGNRVPWGRACELSLLGYTGNVASLPHQPSTVTTPDEFEANTDALVAHVLALAAEYARGKTTKPRVYIGMSGVYTHGGRKFDSMAPDTWRMSGKGSVAKRYSNTHKEARRLVVVIYCFTREDVPPSFAAHRQDQRHVSLAYEAQVSARIKKLSARSDAPVKSENRRDGGGDIGERAKKGAVMYAAIGL